MRYKIGMVLIQKLKGGVVLRGTDDYRIERWFAGGVSLVSVWLANAVGSRYRRS